MTPARRSPTAQPAAAHPTAHTAHTALSARQIDAVRALAAACRHADGVSPLSEAFDLALDRPGRHLVITDPVATADLTVAGPDATAATAAPAVATDAAPVIATDAAHVIAYAGVAPDGSCELFVDPRHRRSGLGRDTWDAARGRGAHTLWGHGALPAGEAFARAVGLTPVRTLLRMQRPVTPGDPDVDTVTASLPSSVVMRRFVPGADDETLARLNAAAFADHREQGSLTVDDLRARMGQPWFDPQGLFFLVPADDPQGEPVAFHWTKHDIAQDPRIGEVYVVGVHPAYQGRGLARPLTRLGLAHLAAAGVAAVDLYVDADNAAAVATYAREGFAVAASDVAYAVAPESG